MPGAASRRITAFGAGVICGLLAILLPVVPGLAQAPLPAVGVAQVRVQDVSPSSEFVGRVEAVNAIDIRARIEGFIQSRPFDEGQTIEAGQELFVIEKAAYEASLASAQASLAGAQATLRDAEARLRRNQELRRTLTVPQATLEESQAARDAARANVMAAEADVQKAELTLSYTSIRTPIAGRIGLAGFAVGSFIGPSSGTLARVVQIDPIRVVFSVNDRVVLDLRAAAGGMSNEELSGKFIPTLRLSNGTEYPAKGEIEFIGNELDARTGTLPIRARFANPDSVLIPGQFVTVVVRLADPQRRPVVPIGAVQLDRDGRFVLILDRDDKVALRRIRTGSQMGQNWTVEEGLSGGESLIVQGQQNARPGAAVRVVSAQNDASPARGTSAQTPAPAPGAVAQ
jgi:membrane fusion protein (multidrug efflux system)